MPPPAIARLEAGLEAQKAGDARRSMSPNKVEKRAKKPAPKQKYRVKFSRFPAEIQQMIWTEAMQKPACHTFKFAMSSERQPNRTWKMDLRAQQINLDTSAYRQWKSMLWNRNYKVPTITDSEESQLEGEDLHRALKEDPSNPRKSSLQKSRQAFSKLANVSFQAGFRRSMIDFQRIRLLTPNRRGLRHAAAIDTATDLSILEFKRGVNDPALHWFEHSTGRMRIDHTRREVSQLKRVAVHYKKSHKNATRRGPFQCHCSSGSQLNCHLYKACPVEQACFLDCFANLKEFYYVVEVARTKELAWKAEYKDHAQRLGYKLQSSKDAASAPFELKRFYDMKNEYIQLCPPAYLQFLPKDLREHGALPLEAIDIGGARECLIKVMEFYKGLRGNDIFKNSLEDRKEVKFGILFAYKIEE